MDVFWFIPTHGDSRYLGTSVGARAAGYDYFRQVAVAADTLGYDGVLLPTGRSCEDAWVVASSLIGATRQLKFLVAVRPGVSSPQFGARMAATFDRLSEGRLLINVVTGGDPGELEGDGIFVSHDQRYAITSDYLHIWRGILEASHRGEAFSFEGANLRSVGGKAIYPTVQKPYPPLYFGGSSEAAHELAAEQVDVYLTWGEPPAAVAAKIADIRARAARRGRTVRFGIRLHVIVRETDKAAWAAADDLISHLDQETVAKAQAAFAKMDSVGQKRMTELHGGRLGGREQLEISPNLWAGVGLVRGGAGTSLVGDPQTVAARIQEYADIGCETFIFSGYPHLEESYRFAELVFPLLPRAQKAPPASNVLTGPFGEIMANTLVPKGNTYAAAAPAANTGVASQVSES